MSRFPQNPNFCLVAQKKQGKIEIDYLNFGCYFCFVGYWIIRRFWKIKSKKQNGGCQGTYQLLFLSNSFSFPLFWIVIKLFVSINVGKIECSFKSSCRRSKKSKEWYILIVSIMRNFILSYINWMLCFWNSWLKFQGLLWEWEG